MITTTDSRYREMQRYGILPTRQPARQARVERFITRPEPVAKVVHTVERRVRKFYPTYVVQNDIKDQAGSVIHAAGKTINPLTTSNFQKKLLFIDGDNSTQVAWALNQQHLCPNACIVLVGGAPVELMKKHKVRFYFDQKSILKLRLGITQVPAIVRQYGSKLQIEEVVLGG